MKSPSRNQPKIKGKKIRLEHKPLRISCLSHSQDQGEHFARSSVKPTKFQKRETVIMMTNLIPLVLTGEMEPPSLEDTWKTAHDHGQAQVLLFRRTIYLLCLHTRMSQRTRLVERGC